MNPPQNQIPNCKQMLTIILNIIFSTIGKLMPLLLEPSNKDMKVAIRLKLIYRLENTDVHVLTNAIAEKINNCQLCIRKKKGRK